VYITNQNDTVLWCLGNYIKNVMFYIELVLTEVPLA